MLASSAAYTESTWDGKLNEAALQKRAPRAATEIKPAYNSHISTSFSADSNFNRLIANKREGDDDAVISDAQPSSQQSAEELIVRENCFYVSDWAGDWSD